MATFNIDISGSSIIVGSTNFKVKYRLESGDPTWLSYLIPVPPTSGTTAVIHGLDNRIYDFQIQNLNGADNPLSLITSDCGITAPDLAISPTSNSVGYNFSNLSQDMTSYTVQLTTQVDPGTILGTHTLPAGSFPSQVIDSFTGLSPLTGYRFVISPVANSFSEFFTYNFTTLASGICPDPLQVTATLT